MKDLLLMCVRYSERANADAVRLIDGLSPADRAMDRGSYYKSLFGLIEHIMGGSSYFLKLFRASLPRRCAPADPVAWKSPADTPTQSNWEELRSALAMTDAGVSTFVAGLKDADLNLPIKLGWYDDRDSVPLYFLISQLLMHGTHHRGQISQILDSMKIEHDFSGIDLEFLPSQPSS